MSSVESSTNEILGQVRLQFEQFRRANEPGTRIPQDLRHAVVDALAQGVAVADLRRTCALGAKQIADWQRPPRKSAKAKVPHKPARVFEVDDGVVAPARLDAVSPSHQDTLELRLGHWAITIRNVA